MLAAAVGVPAASPLLGQLARCPRCCAAAPLANPPQNNTPFLSFNVCVTHHAPRHSNQGQGKSEGRRRRRGPARGCAAGAASVSVPALLQPFCSVPGSLWRFDLVAGIYLRPLQARWWTIEVVRLAPRRYVFCRLGSLHARTQHVCDSPAGAGAPGAAQVPAAGGCRGC